MDKSTANILREIERLKKENAFLKDLLQKHGISFDFTQEPPVQAQREKSLLTLEKKVALFRSLFKGREDVFARRWYSSTTDRRYVRRNGIENFVTKRNTDVLNVPTVNFNPWVTTISTDTWKEETLTEGMLSGLTPSYPTAPAGFSVVTSTTRVVNTDSRMT